MNTFVNAMNEISDKIYTENGAVSYSTTKNANVDMFALASAMRDRQKDLVDIFKKAFEEDKELAIRNLFYMRDIRGGQGERLSFRNCMKWLIDQLSYEEFERFIQYIPTYGRWDDLINLVSVTSGTEKNRAVMIMIRNQLREDISNMEAGKSISLLAKWFPLANNTKNQKAKVFASNLRSALFKSPAQCRRAIVHMRRYLNVLEQKMSEKKWNDINYSAVPSCANKKYRKAFARNDAERYKEYIQSVLKGEAKINSSALYPYEIAYQVFNNDNFNNNFSEKTELDALWNNLPDYTNGNSAICCVDVSGSMYGNTSRAPIYSSMALGLYFAERNEGDFKNKFFTFSRNPDVVNITGESLCEKLKGMYNSDNWGMNTDVYKLFKLYVNMAKRSNAEDCPKSLIIISDMEFDDALGSKKYGRNRVEKDTIFKDVKKLFEENGVAMPTLVFWNVEARQNNVPVRCDENGTILVSGHSPVIFKFIMEGKTPEIFMLDVLNSERYKNIKIFE